MCHFANDSSHLRNVDAIPYHNMKLPLLTVRNQTNANDGHPIAATVAPEGGRQRVSPICSMTVPMRFHCDSYSVGQRMATAFNLQGERREGSRDMVSDRQINEGERQFR